MNTPKKTPPRLCDHGKPIPGQCRTCGRQNARMQNVSQFGEKQFQIDETMDLLAADLLDNEAHQRARRHLHPR